MKLIIANNYDEMSEFAYLEVEKVISSNPKATIGFATGSTVKGLYKNLVKLNKKLDFSKITTINLDEYIGLSKTHPQSYYYFMNKHLFSQTNINKTNIIFPNGKAKDIELECSNYHEKVKNQIIDLQILGVGTNGHIAFIEPNIKLKYHTHIAKLTDSTISSNARFFNNIKEVPTTAITMGIGEIMQAKRILLLANGETKAKAIKALLEDDITTNTPVTILKLHSNLTIIIDKEASKLLELD